MTGALRAVTIACTLIYFGASAYHSGLIVPAGVLTAAAIAEALLGLAAAVVGLIRSPLVAYVIVLAGTLFGLSIVIARGLLGTDLAIHLLMLVGLGVGFALILRARGAPRST